jgi:hypothetical protein
LHDEMLRQIANVYKRQSIWQIIRIYTYKNRGVFNIRKPPCWLGKTSSRK